MIEASHLASMLLDYVVFVLSEPETMAETGVKPNASGVAEAALDMAHGELTDLLSKALPDYGRASTAALRILALGTTKAIAESLAAFVLETGGVVHATDDGMGDV